MTGNLFNIEVEFKSETLNFTVLPVVADEEINYKIFHNNNFIFSLVPSEVAAGDTLRLSPAFHSAGIDEELVKVVAATVESHEE